MAKKDNLFTADEIPSVSFDRLKEYKLAKPVTVNDKTYDVLNVDFESLTSEDMESVAGLPGCQRGDSNMSEFSKTYLLHIVALAAKITIHDVRKFSIVDGTALTLAAQAFLMQAGSKIMGR
jgi:hypothetical protein